MSRKLPSPPSSPALPASWWNGAFAMAFLRLYESVILKHRSRFAFHIYYAIAILAILVIFTLCNSEIRSRAENHYNDWFTNPTDPVSDSNDGKLQCSKIEGADDILVVMKTGTTEIFSKLPIHLNTTFKCMPNYVVFSDLEHDFYGIPVHDALISLKDVLEEDTDEFRLYQKIQTFKPDPAQNASQLAEMSGDVAWNLDKFKFLPILQKTFMWYPDMKWYVFIEADTSLMWPTLLKFLTNWDHTKMLYMGSQSMLGDVMFAHGGSGYIMSHPAVKVLVEEDDEKMKKHMLNAKGSCCGDANFAAALLDHKVPLTMMWPTIQGETPASLDFSDNHWCYPTFTYHHASPEEIEELWLFQQECFAEDPPHYPTVEDVFNRFIWPNLTDERDNWDNICRNGEEIKEKEKQEEMSERERLAIASFEGCREACLEDKDCLLYNWRKGHCNLGKLAMLGKPAEGIRSGWNVARIEKWKNDPSRRNCIAKWPKPES